MRTFVFLIRKNKTKIYSARRNSDPTEQPIDKMAIPPLPADCNHSVPIKSILMCFVCKLSFGLAKTVVAHATGEHVVQLDDEEKRILAQANQLRPSSS